MLCKEHVRKILPAQKPGMPSTKESCSNCGGARFAPVCKDDVHYLPAYDHSLVKIRRNQLVNLNLQITLQTIFETNSIKLRKFVVVDKICLENTNETCPHAEMLRN
jgi:hypothetical protein